MCFCSLEPEWAAAATEVKDQTKGKVKLAAVDATVNQVLASRYGVSVVEARLLIREILGISAAFDSRPPFEGGRETSNRL